jgi:hypothetical protein
VQERLGHSTISITLDTYSHLFPQGDVHAEFAAAEKALLCRMGGYRLSSIEWSPGVALPALEFAPLCVAFFLYAFKTALQNYQIRTRRVATATEYLQTKDSFLPR